LIQDTIEDQVATELLDEKFMKGDVVHISTKNNELSYTTASE
jgi:ATP-dependent Clp protease ATP-binding subunit ClpA